MKIIKPFIFLLIGTLFILSCKEEMDIDPFLKDHSRKFSIQQSGTGWRSSVNMGHFSSYQKQVGTLWMEEAGIAAYFDQEKIITFGTDNNDHYNYDIILSEVNDMNVLDDFVSRFALPIQITEEINTAYTGYLYSGHDEYSMVCAVKKNGVIEGYLSNGFDIYSITPVLPAGEGDHIPGYQVKLYDEYVAAVQLGDNKIFWMTTEYCDATEIILASIVSIIIKCESLNS